MSSHQNLMRGNREFGLAAQLFLHRFDNVVGHKWLSVVLSNMPVSYKAGLTAQVPRKLAAVIVLDDDRVTSIFENVNDRVAV